MNNSNDEQMNFPVEWIMLKSYSQLTEQEQALVLACVTQAEYERLHEIAVMTNDAFDNNEAKPAPDVYYNLMSAFDKKQKVQLHKGVLQAIWSYQLPAYQAVAAMAITALLVMGWHYFTGTITSSAPKTLYVDRRDTIYLPAKPQEFSGKETTQVLEPKTAYVKDKQYDTVSTYKSRTMDKQDLGRSIKHDSSLKQFMVATL